VHSGADTFIAAAAEEGIMVEQMDAQDVPREFPRTEQEPGEYDVSQPVRHRSELVHAAA
jgi:hypothetical protein